MRRFAAFLLIFCLICGLFCISGKGTSDVVLVAVNDSIPSALNEASMPFYSDGALYLPYTVFNTDILGVVPLYSAADHTLTLTSQSSQLTFDLSAGSVSDSAGTTYSQTALTRYGIVFVPASFCAIYFELGISYLTSLGGYTVVRLTTGDEVYSDSLFIEKAENLINYRVSQYTGSQGTPIQNTSDTTPTPSTSSNSPAPSQDEPEEQTPEEPAEQETYYIALTGISASLLDELDSLQIEATFFLTEEQISANANLARRAIGCGYGFGLMVSGEDDPVAAADAANASLQALLCQSSLFVLADSEQKEALEAAGYIVYVSSETESNILLFSSADASARLRILNTENTTFYPLRETTSLPLSAE